LTKQGRGQEKEREDGCEKKSHWLVWSIIYLTDFQPIPVPSNPQHNPERPTRPRGTRPPLPTDWEGRGCDWGESGTREDPPRPREPDPSHHNEQRGIQRGERGTGGQGWVWRLTDRGLGREEGEKRGKGWINL